MRFPKLSPPLPPSPATHVFLPPLPLLPPHPPHPPPLRPPPKQQMFNKETTNFCTTLCSLHNATCPASLTSVFADRFFHPPRHRRRPSLHHKQHHKKATVDRTTLDASFQVWVWRHEILLRLRWRDTTSPPAEWQPAELLNC